MNILLQALEKSPEYEQLLDSISRGSVAAVSGLSQITRSHFLAALHAKSSRPSVFLVQDELAASRLQEELESFLGVQIPILPERELTFVEASGVSRQWEQKRLKLLYDLATGKLPLLIASFGAMALRTMPRAVLFSASILLRVGASFTPEDLIERLTQAGYSRTTLVEGVGQFALRGGILDVYSPGEAMPVRCEFFGDELDAMGFFDSTTQRRTENTEQALLLPVAESLPSLHPEGVDGLCRELQSIIARQRRRKVPHENLITTLTRDIESLQSGVSFPSADRYLALIYPEFSCAADYLSTETAVYFCDHGALSRAAKAQEEEFGLGLDAFLESGRLAGELCEFYLSFDALAARMKGHPVVYFDSFLSARFPENLPPKQLLSVTARQLPGYGGSLETAVSDLKSYVRNDYGCLVLCGGRRRGEILKEMLGKEGVNALLAFPAVHLPQAGQVFLTDGSLPAGLEYPDLRLAILTEGQLLVKKTERKPKPKKAPSNRKKLESFTDLTPGDLVVHEHHGIGRYVGMEQMKVGGAIKDYVKIAYQGTDTLYVPATQLDLVSKYIGSGGENQTVRLNKLGGDQWQKAKAKAKAAAKDLAAGLIQLYAERKRRPGFAFAADSPWQKEFEESFEYAETDDQLRAIAEIKHDMESPAPMERLLCGDVGFGKTEVALRAVMKCILDGKQAAILVPTTVLAQQHYATAQSRFRSFPVTIEVLSRFTTPKEQKRILSNLAEGRVDLIIGTHKLIQKSVKFHDLGLLVIDEEQRFGVSHKEKLREMARQVDTLTLSATPIPRTLNMSLSGLRDMSTLEEPPRDRQAVQTYVLEEDWGVLADACRRELDRGGQVYFLHNRVESIDRVASRLQKLLGPETRIAVGHGQMGEQELSSVMQQMVEGEADILVCTTIIETGIDIPNVNTLIVEDADRMGLAQLHQLRGRIGRSARRAYAYLTYRPGKILQEAAAKRLAAIREYVEFGSGFRIAMRDLEIRGAGNLLGPQQSGTMMSVGYDLYLKLLEEAVLEEKGETRETARECAADLTVNANIPEKYVPSAQQRMDLYRRIASIRTNDDASDVLDELIDRYGEPPKPVLALLDVALLRSAAVKAGVGDISQRGDKLKLRLDVFHPAALSAVCAMPKYRRSLLLSGTDTPTLTLTLPKGADVLETALTLVEDLQLQSQSPA